MEKEILSRFKEKPKTKIGWRVLYLGLSTLLIPPLFGFSGTIIRLLIDKVSVNPNASIGIPMGFNGALISLALSIFTIITGVRALKIGERSWAIWLGFIPAILVAIFWIFMFVGEIIFPH
jgi:hypothetical protein